MEVESWTGADGGSVRVGARGRAGGGGEREDWVYTDGDQVGESTGQFG